MRRENWVSTPNRKRARPENGESQTQKVILSHFIYGSVIRDVVKLLKPLQKRQLNAKIIIVIPLPQCVLMEL